MTQIGEQRTVKSEKVYYSKSSRMSAIDEGLLTYDDWAIGWKALGKPYPSVKEMVGIFKMEGVSVYRYEEGKVDEPLATHSIWFSGTYDRAMRVVMIALRYNLHLCSLHQHWGFTSNDIGKPSWEISLFAAEDAE